MFVFSQNTDSCCCSPLLFSLEIEFVRIFNNLRQLCTISIYLSNITIPSIYEYLSIWVCVFVHTWLEYALRNKATHIWILSKSSVKVCRAPTPHLREMRIFYLLLMCLCEQNGIIFQSTANANLMLRLYTNQLAH